MESTMKPTASWRSLLKVHPAAEMFPEMVGDEFKSLVEDIREHGLKTLIHTWFDKDEQEWILDGRNRLNALEELGYRFKIVKTGGYGSARPHLKIIKPAGKETVYVGHHFAYGHQVTDPYAYVISANIHRRHLTGAQKSELIAALLKADPTKSDRAIAEVVKVSDKTVGAKRKELEAGAEIPQVEKRVGADGKAYKQPTPTKTVPAATSSIDPTDEQPLPEPLASMVEQYKKLGKDKLAEIGEAYVETKLEKAQAYLAPDVDQRTLPAAGRLPPHYDAWANTVRVVSWQLGRLLDAEASVELFFKVAKNAEIVRKLSNRLEKLLRQSDQPAEREPAADLGNGTFVEGLGVTAPAQAEAAE